jgi:hypothetical protein
MMTRNTSKKMENEGAASDKGLHVVSSPQSYFN